MMNTRSSILDAEVRYIKGVGPKRAIAFERLGIRSVRELLYFFPRRYEDRSQFRSISQLKAGEHASVRAEILQVRLKPIRRMPILEVMVGDNDGVLHAIWFNQPYLKNQFQTGTEVILFGKVEFYQNRFQMTSPEYEFVERDEDATHTGRITPIYPLTEGLFQRSLRSTMKDIVLNHLDKTLDDPLAEPLRLEKNLMPLAEAIRQMHFPESQEKQTQARRRIVFDEFLIFEIRLLSKMKAMKTKYHSTAVVDRSGWKATFLKSLPFELTRGQHQSVEDLAADLQRTVPMNRLLQGDVGSGKTVVAAFAAGLAARNHYQTAMLVPTEILAEQHYRTLLEILSPFEISVRLLTSSTPAPQRERMVAELRQGKISILVGTHALLQEDIRFEALALVIIDEQHKFGVHQRCVLLDRDPRPHQLVMTATPIPRTLALTVYGDLDISTMPELPRGRKPIRTYWITRAKEPEILEHIRKKLAAHEQAYFIFPLIEETEKSDLLAAKREYERLRKFFSPAYRVGLVHGRLNREERDTIMKAFRAREIHCLVATSVIEVGIDHPNATMMVIENAERFGLSQLHQLRGRIGRGSLESECFLFGEPKTEEGKKRLRIMTKTQDGFQIAEEDLVLRGPGDFWGTRQSGEPFFRVANPILDYPVLIETRAIASRLVKDGELERSAEWEKMKNYLELYPLQY